MTELREVWPLRPDMNLPRPATSLHETTVLGGLSKVLVSRVFRCKLGKTSMGACASTEVLEGVLDEGKEALGEMGEKVLDGKDSFGEEVAAKLEDGKKELGDKSEEEILEGEESLDD